MEVTDIEHVIIIIICSKRLVFTDGSIEQTKHGAIIFRIESFEEIFLSISKSSNFITIDLLATYEGELIGGLM